MYTMLLVTTSRHVPVAVKKSALTFAEKNEGTYLNRGKKTIEELVSYARTNGFDKIAIISSKKIEYLPRQQKKSSQSIQNQTKETQETKTGETNLVLYIKVKSSGWNWE